MTQKKSTETLDAEAKAKAEAEAKAKALKTVRLKRCYWRKSDGIRISKGTVCELPADEARALLREEKAEIFDADLME